MTDESKHIVDKNCNSELIFIPAGCTSLEQAMDVSVNRPFKQHMRDLWVKWFSNHTLRTVHGNPKTPSWPDVINWVSAAWDSIKAEAIQESFLLCGITAAVDGSENDKMFPRVALEEISDEKPSDEDVDDIESSDEDNGMVSGDEFEGFDTDH